MTVEYELRFSDTPPELEVTTSGLADLDGLRALILAATGDARYRSGMTVLLDHRALDFAGLSPTDIRELAEFALAHDDRLGGSIVAEVNPTPSSYGLTRMWQAFSEGDSSLRYRVFFRREDAVSWLSAFTG